VRNLFRQLKNLFLNNFFSYNFWPGLNYASKIKQAQQTGYNVVLLFWGLQKVNRALERVKKGLKKEGITTQIKLSRGGINEELKICLTFIYQSFMS